MSSWRRPRAFRSSRTRTANRRWKPRRFTAGHWRRWRPACTPTASRCYGQKRPLPA
jgi:hypothetical protein